MNLDNIVFPATLKIYLKGLRAGKYYQDRFDKKEDIIAVLKYLKRTNKEPYKIKQVEENNENLL